MTQFTAKCPNCETRFVWPVPYVWENLLEIEEAHCPHCGTKLERTNRRSTLTVERIKRPLRGREARSIFAAAVLLLGLFFSTPAAALDEPEQLVITTARHYTPATKDKGSTLYRALGLATYGAIGADLTTTELGLARGLVEGNPIQRHRAVRIVSHVALGIFWNEYLTEGLRKKGHPKAALWMRIAAVAAYGLLTARNVHLIANQ